MQQHLIFDCHVKTYTYITHILLNIYVDINNYVIVRIQLDFTGVILILLAPDELRETLMVKY